MMSAVIAQIRNIIPIFLDVSAWLKGWGKSMYVLMLKPNTINRPPIKPYHGLYVSHDFRVKIITKPTMFKI